LLNNTRKFGLQHRRLLYYKHIDLSTACVAGKPIDADTCFSCKYACDTGKEDVGISLLYSTLSVLLIQVGSLREQGTQIISLPLIPHSKKNTE